MSSQEYSDQGYSDGTGQQPGAASAESSGTVARAQSSSASASHRAGAHAAKKGSNHLGLKILIGGLVLVTLAFVISNIKTDLRIFWNTLVWILAIIGLIWAFIKIRQLEKEHQEKADQEKESQSSR